MRFARDVRRQLESIAGFDGAGLRRSGGGTGGGGDRGAGGDDRSADPVTVRGTCGAGFSVYHRMLIGTLCETIRIAFPRWRANQLQDSALILCVGIRGPRGQAGSLPTSSAATMAPQRSRAGTAVGGSLGQVLTSSGGHAAKPCRPLARGSARVP